MYVFYLNYNSIYLLTFEGVKDNSLIKYWNHKSGKIKTIKISKEQLNNLNYYKIYSKAKDLISKNILWQSFGENFIEGAFILTLSSINIYNRFKRQFGSKLKWFMFIPYNVVQLLIN